MTDASSAPPYASDLLSIAELLGDSLRGTQLAAVCAALDDDRAGVLALAERIARMRDLRSPVAVFVSRIRRGDYHLRRAPAIAQAWSPDADPAEVLRRLYFAKLDVLDRIGWRTPIARQREALDYACGSLPSCRHAPMPEGGIGALEDELCVELGIDRHG